LDLAGDVLHGPFGLVSIHGSLRGCWILFERSRARAFRKNHLEGQMLFALDKVTGEVLILASPVDAPDRCKPVDVKDGFWLFFADDGSPLEARFDPTEGPDDVPDAYSLERAMSGLWLQERLDKVAIVTGGGVDTVEGLAELLKINRGKRIAALNAALPRGGV
jgi:hypothetical protein